MAMNFARLASYLRFEMKNPVQESTRDDVIFPNDRSEENWKFQNEVYTARRVDKK